LIGNLERHDFGGFTSIGDIDSEDKALHPITLQVSLNFHINP
jgi:hypothetical protein